ncbi:MAG: hypothetical protein KDJ30_03435, partial [Rhodoblastus sp.]|nr:hypothetical protein [Rhodoblastus sp.]
MHEQIAHFRFSPAVRPISGDNSSVGFFASSYIALHQLQPVNDSSLEFRTAMPSVADRRETGADMSAGKIESRADGPIG